MSHDAGDLVDELLAMARARLQDQFADPPPPPAIIASTDRLETMLRARLTECGIDPDDDVVRATLLVVTDTLAKSHSLLPVTCGESARFWWVTVQFALAVLQLDAHEGARP